jgi:hypothetical protein
MFEYGWPRGTPAHGALPGYILAHPGGERPLAVLGCYSRKSGGCDVIAQINGGLPAVFQAAERLSALGCNVLMGGLALSSDVELSRTLARDRHLVILQLITPLPTCVDQLHRRRKRSRSDSSSISERTARHAREIDLACAALASLAHVEQVSFAAALERARSLLKLPASHDAS